MRIIDTHCHLDFPQFDADRLEIINELKEKNIDVINISTSLESIPKVIELIKNKQIWGMIGLHPTDIEPTTIIKLPDLLKEWATLIDNNPKLVGIGEIGLDYFHNRSSEAASRQKGVLKQFLTLALEKDFKNTMFERF